MPTIPVSVGIGLVGLTVGKMFGLFAPKVEDKYLKPKGVTYGDPIESPGGGKRKREEMAASGMVMPGASDVAYETVPVIAPGLEGIDNVVALFDNICEKYSDRPAMGERELLKTHDLGNGLEKLSMSPDYTFITYSDFMEEVKETTAGLMAKASLKPKDIITIYAETKKDWVLLAHSCFRLNVAVATVYATLGPDGVLSAINQTHSSVLVVDGKLLKNVLKISDEAKYTKTIVYVGSVKEDLLAQAKAKGWNVLSMEDIKSAGKSNLASLKSLSYPKAQDTCVIMYTSGTTGKPKGVIISHRNFLAGIRAMRYCMSLIGLDENATYLAYLPLAHIMELVVQTSGMTIGAKLGFGSPGTLADISPKIAEGSVGDATALQPTVFLAAPSVLDKIKANLTMKVSASKIKTFMFNTAMYFSDSRRKANIERGFVGTPFIWNKIVFEKVQALLGGRVGYIATGSAPLSDDAQAFAEISFDCPLSQGYGLTETTSCGLFQHPTDRRSGLVGGPMKGCIMKLLDWEEGNYRISDQDNPDIGMARGEILIGGGIVTEGYYQEPGNIDPQIAELEKESYSVDENNIRWFHTGDIGALDPKDGVVRIIDRKKDLVKLAMGEYVALSKVENVLKNSPYVDQVMVYALSSMSYCIALVVPNQTLVKWAHDNGHGKDLGLEEVCNLSVTSEEMLRSFRECTKGKLQKFEVPAKVALTPIAWTPDNDLTTAAFKLKRIPIKQSCQHLIDAVYT